MRERWCTTHTDFLLDGATRTGDAMALKVVVSKFVPEALHQWIFNHEIPKVLMTKNTM